MGRVTRWVRVGYLGALVASLLLFFTACALFNEAPTAVITASVLSGTSPLVVNFDSSGSVDPDGDTPPVFSVLWNFGDGVTSTEISPHHTFIAVTTATTFTVTLRATDVGGASDETTQTIEVLPQSSSGGGTGMPTAHITVDHFIGPTPLAVAFDGSTSQAGMGTITQYNWDFGDGTTSTGSHAAHTYKPDATHEYMATLFVWNSEGNLDTDQVKIIVIVPDAVTAGDEPVADFSMSDPLLLYDSPTPASMPTLYEVSFDPRGSYADAGHSIVYFAWDFGDGTTFVETSDLEVTHVYSLVNPSRSYAVRLFVYDDQGLEGTKVVNLTLSQPVDE
jgi:PKD repeat protein